MSRPTPPIHRRQLLQAGSLVLLLGTQHLARGASIVAVRVWPAPDYTRVTIESDTTLTARQQMVGSPPRLAVDIEGIDLNPALRELVAKVKSDDPFINGIRIGQNAPGVVRMVIDLKQDALPQVFALAPVAAYQHRLVLDLHPAHEIDPLEALIADRLKDDAQSRGATAAAQSAVANAPQPAIPTPPAHDALGELIARQTQKPPADAPKPPIATESIAQAARPQAAKPQNNPAPVASRTDRLIIVALDPGHGG